jgi:hypothetical protein
VGEWGHVWDGIGLRMFGTDGRDAGVTSFAGFGEGIVTAVEVFAFLQSCE